MDNSKLLINGLFVAAFVALIVFFRPWESGDLMTEESSLATSPHIDNTPPPPENVDLKFVNKQLDVGPPAALERTVELTVEEWRDIKRAAKQRNESISEYVRERLLSETPSPEIKAPMEAS